jgi:hypothetical protein
VKGTGGCLGHLGLRGARGAAAGRPHAAPWRRSLPPFAAVSGDHPVPEISSPTGSFSCSRRKQQISSRICCIRLMVGKMFAVEDCQQSSGQAQPSRRQRMLLHAPAPSSASARLTISSAAPPSTRPSKLNDEEAYLPIQEAYRFFSSNRRRLGGSLFNLDIRSDKQLHARYVGPSLTFLLCKTEIPIPDLSYLAICTRFPIPTAEWQQVGHAVNGAAVMCTRSILCTRHCLVSVSISVVC